MKKLIFLLFIFLFLVPTVFAEQESLVEKYSPILYFSQKENFFPVSVDYFLTSSELKMLEGLDVKTVKENPKLDDISNITEWYYFLDHKFNGSEAIASDYSRKKDGFGYTVYYSLKRDGDYTILQYWFFYAYSKSSVNQHEGDLELIQITLDSNNNPLSTTYSQHLLGENVFWSDIDKQQDHPKIYVALGSHANYFKSYQGNLGLESDIVEDNGPVLESSDYTLVNLDDPTQKWINFGGRWGNFGSLDIRSEGERGVHGPKHGDRAEAWNTPIKWASKTLSVNWIWFAGSWIIENFYLLFGIVITFAISSRIYKLRKRGLDITPLKRLLGQKHAVGFFAVIIGTAITLIALVSPLYVVSLNVEKGIYATNGTLDIIRVDGIGGAKINTLQANKGEFSLFGLGLPITLLVIVGVILGIVDIIFLNHPRKLAKKYIIGAIYPLLPLILIVLFVSFLSGILPSFSNFASGQDSSPELSDAVNKISKAPFSGRYSFISPYFGSINLVWGIGIGAYLFLLAAALKIAGGIIFFTYKSPKRNLFKPSK